MRNRGFTLVEVSIVLLIIALLSLPLFDIYRAYVPWQRQETTNNNLDASADSVFELMGVYKDLNAQRYPCPARLDLPSTDPNYGLSSCPPAGNPLPGACSNGICRANGRVIKGVTQTVLIGMVPVRTINTRMFWPDGTEIVKSSLPDHQVHDAWGNRLTYVVSEELTDAAKFDSFRGAVKVADENGQTLSDTAYHYAIISHGDNGAGAYNDIGTVNDPCPAGQTESGNCDLSGNFVSGLRSVAQGPTVTTYYDDFIRFRSFKLTDVWAYSTYNQNSTGIYNLTAKNVGIGTTNPQAKLDIQGSMKATYIHTKQFCDKTGQNCYDPTKIAGNDPDMQCPGGQVVTSIGKDAGGVVRVNCGTITWAVPNKSCPAGKFVVAVSNLGNLRCCNIVAGVPDKSTCDDY